MFEGLWGFYCHLPEFLNCELGEGDDFVCSFIFLNVSCIAFELGCITFRKQMVVHF